MSRERILAAIGKNKPERLPLPELPAFRTPGADLETPFREMLGITGSRMIEFKENQSLESLVSAYFPDEKSIASNLPGFPGTVDLESIQTPGELHAVDLAVLPARIGVAENGALWLTEKECGHRVLPFIAQHLLLVLDRENLVGNMHEAYQRIRIEETGFGVFIGGPSKTADIEQALVIGAQGPRSLTVLLR